MNILTNVVLAVAAIVVILLWVAGLCWILEVMVHKSFTVFVCSVVGYVVTSIAIPSVIMGSVK